MPRILFFLILLAAVGAWVYCVNRYYKKRDVVMDEFYDLRLFLIDLWKEDTLSIKEWREWLPICRFAGQRLRELYDPHLDDRGTCEYFVLQILRKLQGISK